MECLDQKLTILTAQCMDLSGCLSGTFEINTVSAISAWIVATDTFVYT